MILNRYFYQFLLKWKKNPQRKPLLLQGARQTGKTFLLKYFAEKEFSDFVYINFEEEQEFAESLKNTANPKTILEYLGLYKNRSIDIRKTLIIFDEAQNCPQVVTSLKYFYENYPEGYIVATGSLLGISLTDNKSGSFPVGTVDIQHLYPLTFFEFLDALNETSLLQHLISKRDFSPLPDIFHNKLIKLLKLYFLIGGMPEAVKTYLETKGDWQAVRKIQKDILSAYLIDSVRYADKTESVKIRQIWDNIPQQISGENKRFKLSAIKKNASLREYRTALNWLISAGLLYKVEKNKRIALPLSAYKDEHLFKIFFLDIGLLSALLNLSPQTLLNGNSLFLQFKGWFTENYIAQELQSRFKTELYYWANHTSEIDFILSYNDNIIPIEIKSGFNTKAKSLRVYIEKNTPQYAIRSSLRNFHVHNNLYDIPLYAISRFPELIFRKN